jgi:hypothetical protein
LCRRRQAKFPAKLRTIPCHGLILLVSQAEYLVSVQGDHRQVERLTVAVSVVNQRNVARKIDGRLLQCGNVIEPQAPDFIHPANEAGVVGAYLSGADAQRVFGKLADLAHSSGHTIVVIEHKLNLLSSAHWIIEFGPGGGPAGGRVVFQGSYEELLIEPTPSSKAIHGSGVRITPRRPVMKSPQTSDAAGRLSHVAEVFESFVANQEVREDQQVIQPLHPALHLAPARFPEDIRVIELLDLLPLLRKHCQPKLPYGVIGKASSEAVGEAIHARVFAFSPVAPQRRLGLATPLDFVDACKQLQRMGFKHVWSRGGLSTLMKVLRTRLQIA